MAIGPRYKSDAPILKAKPVTGGGKYEEKSFLRVNVPNNLLIWEHYETEDGYIGKNMKKFAGNGRLVPEDDAPQELADMADNADFTFEHPDDRKRYYKVERVIRPVRRVESLTHGSDLLRVQTEEGEVAVQAKSKSKSKLSLRSRNPEGIIVDGMQRDLVKNKSDDSESSTKSDDSESSLLKAVSSKKKKKKDK